MNQQLKKSLIDSDQLVPQLLSALWDPDLQRAVSLATRIYENSLSQVANQLQRLRSECIHSLFAKRVGLQQWQSEQVYRLIRGQRSMVQKPWLLEMLERLKPGRSKPVFRREVQQLEQRSLQSKSKIQESLLSLASLFQLQSSSPEVAPLFFQFQFDSDIQDPQQNSRLPPHSQSVDARLHGFAVQRYPDGSQFEGEFIGGKFNGRGKLVYADGSYYEGEWVNGKAQGYGQSCQMQGKTKYEGQWKNDVQNGFGLMSWPDTSCYEGFFLNGKKHGKGYYQWADGSFYTGDWKNGKQHGKGKIVWVDGRDYQGDWIMGKMQGSGKFKWSDGREFQGVYKGNRKQGYGKMRDARGRVVEGFWKRGKFVGGNGNSSP